MKLSTSRLLIINDDGIDAPGIAVLAKAARDISDDVWVVAPISNQSAKSRSMTLREPIEVQKRDERIFAIGGSPVDCALLAFMKLLQQDGKTTLVLSGVNSGGNLAEDVGYSGTVGAAFEAAKIDAAAIAFSQVRPEDGESDIDWSMAEVWVPSLLNDLKDYEMAPGQVFNVNLPDCRTDQVQGVELCAQGRRSCQVELHDLGQYKGRSWYIVSNFSNDDATAEETYLHAVARNFIAVTPLRADNNDLATLNKLKQELG